MRTRARDTTMLNRHLALLDPVAPPVVPNLVESGRGSVKKSVNTISIKT